MKKGQNKKTYKPAPHPVIGPLIRLTAGGRHGIYEATLGQDTFLVRKPVTQ